MLHGKRTDIKEQLVTRATWPLHGILSLLREFDLKIDFKSVDVTGRSVDIPSFSNEWRETVTDLAKSIAERRAHADRSVVAIGGPSGSSKSTTAQVLAIILQENLPIPVKTVSLDGYHYPKKYLEAAEDDTGAPP